ncbi:MAG: preprotein translocase subunit SecG [Ruminococcaceae bacterium]|nr:preprotein translocase subunit SecG [Oscillospiraceae bacterium]
MKMMICVEPFDVKTRNILEVIMISSLINVAALTETATHPAVVLQYVLGSVLIFLSVVLTTVILFQSAKDKRLSGAIAGGTESFFGKSKAKTTDRILSKVTVVVSILVVLVTVALVVIINCVPTT